MIDSIRENERRHHWFWMVGVLVVIWLMWVLPYHLIPSLYAFGAVAVALGIFTGIVLGVGRQGIDLLAIRLFAASTAVLADSPAVCSGPADCFHAYEIGLVGFGLFATVVLAVFAIGSMPLAVGLCVAGALRLVRLSIARAHVTA